MDDTNNTLRHSKHNMKPARKKIKVNDTNSLSDDYDSDLQELFIEMTEEFSRNIDNLGLKSSSAENSPAKSYLSSEESQNIERQNAFNQQLLSSMTKIHTYFLKLKPNNKNDVFKKILQLFCKTIDVKYGFIAEYVHDDTEYLKNLAITNIIPDSSDPFKTKFSNIQDKLHDIKFVNFNNLFGEVIKNKNIVISNDVENDPRSSGVPEGHIKITNFIGIPLIYNDELIGEICFMNKSDGFSMELYEQVEPLINQCSIFLKFSIVQQREHEKELYLKKFFSATKDNIVIIDRAANIIDMNNNFIDTIGKDRKDIFNKNFSNFFTYLRKGTHKQNYINKQLFKKSYIGTNGNVILNTNINENSVKYVEIHRTKLIEGKYMCLIFDITKIIQQRENARKQTQSVIEVSNMKDAFLANVSHEIRTPLHGIIGMAQLLLRDSSLPSKYRSKINTIKNSGDDLLTIINDILDLSKLESGKIQMQYSPFDIQECIKDTIKLVHFRAKEKNLYIKHKCDKHTPNKIIGDQQRIRQILMNLLSNAIKFTHDGGITIKLHSKNLHHKNEYSIKIDIIDTGIGIKEKHFDKLFKPFSQIDNSDTKLYKGTGLGLVISKQLAELMNGDITFTSKYNKGSIFCLEFVAKKYTDSIVEELIKNKSVNMFEGQRILIVDDNDNNRQILCNLTLSWKMMPTTCSTAEEAITFIKSGVKFDIGFIDINMPKMNGNQLCERIKEIMPNIPLIAISSSDINKVNKKFSSYCLKPIYEDQLLKIVLDVLANNRNDQKIKKKSGVNHKIQILIAEDNLINQNVIRETLYDLGYHHLKIVDNGKIAYNEIKKNPEKYDLIFMDLKMPVMDGYTAIKKISSFYNNSKYKKPYIAALTAVVNNREPIIEYIDAYLLKPIKIEELVRILNIF